MNKVSIIMPVYNAVHSISIAVSSILDQQYENWELIIIDDGSTDGSSELCDSFAVQDTRVRVFHKENGGVSSARNIGLASAEGKYIMFVDSDDWIDTDTLDIAIRIIDQTNTDLVVYKFYVEIEYPGQDAHIILDREHEIFEFVGNQLWEKILTSNMIGGFVWNKIFKLQLIKSYFHEEYHICEDLVFTAEYLKNISKMVVINSPMYHYFRGKHGGMDHRRKPVSTKEISAVSAYQFLEQIYRTNAPMLLSEINKNLLKRFINYRARCKINATDNEQVTKWIDNGIKKYWKRVMKDSKISFKTKANILFSLCLPRTLFTLKLCFLNLRNRDIL